MPVEAVTYIGDLDPAAPTGAQPKGEGDDHVRNTKAALRKSFAGFSGAILVTGVDGGAVNAYTLSPATPLPAYSARMKAVFSPSVTNTGAATLNISGLGAKPLVSVAGAPLVANDLVAGRYYEAIYDGAQFRLTSVTKNYSDQLIAEGIVPGVNDPANVGRFFKAGATWESIDGRGAPVADKGNTGTAAQVVNYADGEAQTIRATGNHTLSATGFPAGRIAGVLLRMVDYGNFALTTTGITWVKADKTKTTNFSQSGIALPAVGEGFAVLFSYGDGIVYGKAA